MTVPAKRPPRTPPPKRNGSGLISARAANVVIGVVTAVWAANILAGMAKLNGYQPMESVNGIFMVIVGGAVLARSKGRDE